MQNRNKRGKRSEAVKCPKCDSKAIVKDGRRKSRFEAVQKYKCKSCGNNFTNKRLCNRSYSAKVIMGAINNYNQGLTLEQSSKEINKRFGVNTYPRLLGSWLSSFKELCSYARIRKTIGPAKEKEAALHAQLFDHKQPYLFRYHKIKVERFLSAYFVGLADYLRKVVAECPNNLFMEENQRCSQIKADMDINARVQVSRKKNYACKLADFALRAIKTNRERHDFVENFMLINDTATIATEIPVWLFPNEVPEEIKALKMLKLDKPLTGHVDLLQSRYGLIYLLDFKPQAAKVNAVPQLFAYALALSTRTNIWLRNFRCAWFDEKDYFEFDPNEIVLASLEPCYKHNEHLICKYIQNEQARSYYTSSRFHETHQTILHKNWQKRA